MPVTLTTGDAVLAGVVAMLLIWLGVALLWREPVGDGETQAVYQEEVRE